MDLLIYFAIAAVYIFMIVAIFVTNKKIVVKGRQPGRTPGIVVFAAAILYFVFFRLEAGDVRRTYMLLLLGIGLLFLFVRTGVSKDGIYVHGWLTPFDKLMYYTFENSYNEYARLRANAKNREYAILFDEKDKELVTAMFIEAEVTDFETYKHAYNANAAERKRRKEERKRNKKK